MRSILQATAAMAGVQQMLLAATRLEGNCELESVIRFVTAVVTGRVIVGTTNFPALRIDIPSRSGIANNIARPAFWATIVKSAPSGRGGWIAMVPRRGPKNAKRVMVESTRYFKQRLTLLSSEHTVNNTAHLGRC
jgi:hypothetical protein